LETGESLEMVSIISIMEKKEIITVILDGYGTMTYDELEELLYQLK